MPSKMSEKLAATKQVEIDADAENKKQVQHDLLLGAFTALKADFEVFSQIAFPSSLEEFDLEVTKEFVQQFERLINFLKVGEPKTKKAAPKAPKKTASTAPKAKTKSKKGKKGKKGSRFGAIKTTVKNLGPGTKRMLSKLN